jgi:DNA processing protein
MSDSEFNDGFGRRSIPLDGSTFRYQDKRVARFEKPEFRAFSPDELLGPLNGVERRNAPSALFVAGRADLLRAGTRVAIVGSRKATPAGLRRAARLGRYLVTNRVTVVSGLAEGIDQAAHRAAIDTRGATVAVLGTPLDQVYPKKHADLQQRIVSEHCAVTQFPIGAPILPHNFVQRNRTMALLCHASVIVEAGDSSGTLSQGWEALRLGRPLFIMNSVVERADLRWPAQMLRYGAVVLNEPEDILEFIPTQTGELSAVAAF